MCWVLVTPTIKHPHGVLGVWMCAKTQSTMSNQIEYVSICPRNSSPAKNPTTPYPKTQPQNNNP